jgi:hypothetical protein
MTWQFYSKINLLWGTWSWWTYSGTILITIHRTRTVVELVLWTCVCDHTDTATHKRQLFAKLFIRNEAAMQVLRLVLRICRLSETNNFIRNMSHVHEYMGVNYKTFGGLLKAYYPLWWPIINVEIS